MVINAIRTLSGRFITRHHIGPRALQIRAWACLAADTDDLAEKKRCPEAIVALDPTLDWAQTALATRYIVGARRKRLGSKL